MYYKSKATATVSTRSGLSAWGIGMASWLACAAPPVVYSSAPPPLPQPCAPVMRRGWPGVGPAVAGRAAEAPRGSTASSIRQAPSTRRLNGASGPGMGPFFCVGSGCASAYPRGARFRYAALGRAAPGTPHWPNRTAHKPASAALLSGCVENAAWCFFVVTKFTSTF